MTDEHRSSTDLNLATDGEDTESVRSTKDESLQPVATTSTIIVDENGYESECSSSSRSEADLTRSTLQVEADAFTRFIERQRLEVMFELRRLRLGERPVTGQPNRERIETFLNHMQDHQQEQPRVPSTRPVVPSAHVADIDALTDRRCVSAALGSLTFRQDLENTVRRSIGTRVVQQQQQPAQTSQVRTTPVVVQQQPQSQPQPQPTSVPIQQTPLNVDRQENELRAWQAITELQRERIVVEISDLVHRQLVTTALESDFRRHLEQNVLTRLEHGAPPQQAAPAVLQPHVPRPPPPPAPATASPATLDALTTRLDSMQQMLQLMFTMQMDMQRSLRQEVASALANHPSSTTITTTTTNQNSIAHPMQAGHCTVCLTAIADTVLYRCGHLCVCYICGLQLQQNQSGNGVKCPICRAPVEDILRVYRSSRDGE